MIPEHLQLKRCLLHSGYYLLHFTNKTKIVFNRIKSILEERKEIGVRKDIRERGSIVNYYLCASENLSCYPSGDILALRLLVYFLGVVKARELLAACYVIWTLLQLSWCAPLVTTSHTQQTVFFHIFASLSIFTAYFLLQKNDIFRTVSEPAMICALDNYYTMLNITIFF